jgi:hypothetical protein
MYRSISFIYISRFAGFFKRIVYGIGIFCGLQRIVAVIRKFLFTETPKNKKHKNGNQVCLTIRMCI